MVGGLNVAGTLFLEWRYLEEAAPWLEAEGGDYGPFAHT